MALPKIVLHGRKIILLSGFKDETNDASVCAVVVNAKNKLREAAKRDPNAVAFGYAASKWIAAA